MLVKMMDKFDMQREFKKFDRDYFSLDGYQAILDFFDECDCGKATDLDVIAICCDFSEESIEYIYDEYSNIDRSTGYSNYEDTLKAINEAIKEMRDECSNTPTWNVFYKSEYEENLA